MSPSSRLLARLVSSATAAAALLAMPLAAPLAAQQVPDRAFSPPVPRPAFAAGAGPRLCLDEAHHNFHTLDNRFWAFGELARRDGYRVMPSRASFSASALAGCDLLVISNAQWNDTPWDRYPTPTPSAFTPEEIAAVARWVEGGGQLLLIADHMPLAGAAMALAAAFGAEFTDGFAYKGVDPAAKPDSIQRVRGTPTMFTRAEGTLAAHPIAMGRDSTERVGAVRSFTGQAFRIRGDGTAPVMVLPADFVVIRPRYAWQFDARTPQDPVGGWLQGATRRVGSGRAAFFGEAAMFSAQVAGANRNPMGMNAPGAEQNAQFVLNTLHWLSGLLDR
ncbi:MAG: DUF4350 domain-containing protein [Gemmatimonadaceae bacterium]|nr:DUF4350 domain-containing protein [Gemmatimonadaceae bacterium]